MVNSSLIPGCRTANKIIESFEDIPLIVFDDHLVERYYEILEGGPGEHYNPYEEKEVTRK